MSWREVQLGDGIHVKHGFAFKGEYFAASGEYMVLTPGNFLEKGGFRVRDGKERFYHANFPEEYLLAEGDLIVAMTEQGEGLLGSAARIPSDGKYLHNQRLGLVQITDSELLDKRFLYWVFNSAVVRAQIRASATGAKVKHTAPERIKKVRLKVPKLSDQQAIAWVLDSYDDLIATNQRRIALLEDAARRLYREWFVHLRFPGHEPVSVKDGVPEGWSLVAIGECFDFQIGGGWGKEYSESGSSDAAYVIRGTDLPRIRDGELGGVPLRFHPERNLASRILEPGDVVFEVSGGSRDQGVGRLLHVSRQLLEQFDNPVMCASFCKLIRPKRGLSEFLACTLEHLRATASLKSFENQSASNIVNFAFSEFCKKQVTLVPAEIVLRVFRSTVAPLWEQAAALAQQQAKLTRARDLLLPKLMSGQLNVSGIPLPEEVAA